MRLPLSSLRKAQSGSIVDPTVLWRGAAAISPNIQEIAQVEITALYSILIFDTHHALITSQPCNRAEILSVISL